jgi:hypothetical protein
MAKSALDQGRGMGRKTSRVITLRVSAETDRKLKEAAARSHSTVGEMARHVLELATNDPGGMARIAAGIVAEDFGGPRIEVERVLVDPELAERAGQLRLVDG